VRLLELLALVAVLLAVALVVLLARDRSARHRAEALASARWEDVHEAAGGTTRVLVRRVARLPSGETRVLGESLVDEIPDGAPDWHERFATARQIAYDRAIDLNGGPYLT
jgi:hypothetical protein